MSKHKYSKTDIVFHFNDVKFPSNLIAKDTMLHKELLYTKESTEPEIIKNKKSKLSGCFFTDEEFEASKLVNKKQINYNNNYNNTNKTRTPQNEFKKGEHEETDNFNLKDKNASNFKRAENTINTLYSGTGLNNSNNNEEIKNIDNISKINEKLQYPEDQKLWYLYNPLMKCSTGPIASSVIKEMAKNKIINKNLEIRLIDCYSISNKDPFTFVTLEEVLKPEFIETIEISSLFKQVTSALNLNDEGKPKVTKKIVIVKKIKKVKSGNI